ncbi:recombinase family protein [Actinoplanes sp. NPDC049596]|uniref:recombinase family protein n=1 Tax=unclassified Actinoplanes TaxID=2626549 RepID=UPI00342D1AF7
MSRSPALGYVRVSDVRGRGDELLSPELQRYAIEQYAARHRITVVEWIVELDASGRTFRNRRIDTIADGVSAGRWSCALLWKWSRWGRDLRDSLVYLDRIETAGGVVRAVTEDIDQRSRFGRFTRDELLSIAGLQSDLIADGWKEVHARRRRAGLPHTGGPRLGYHYRNGRYEIDPAAVVHTVDAYTCYVAGVSHRALAARWNEAGLRTVAGNLWTGQSMARMMDTGFAAGLIRERADLGTSTDARRGIAAFAWRLGVHEPIIDLDLWQRYQQRRAARPAVAARAAAVTYPLSELLRCGFDGCGTRMVTTRAGRNKIHSWVCPHARDQRTHAFNSISNRRAMTAVRAWLITQQNSSLGVYRDAATTLADLDAQIERLRQERYRLTDVYTDGHLTRTEFRAIKDEIEAAIQHLGQRAVAILEQQPAAGDNFDKALIRLRDDWDQLPPEEHRDALAAVLHHVLVMPGPHAPGKIQPVGRWAQPEIERAL